MRQVIGKADESVMSDCLQSGNGSRHSPIVVYISESILLRMLASISDFFATCVHYCICNSAWKLVGVYSLAIQPQLHARLHAVAEHVSRPCSTYPRDDLKPTFRLCH